MAVLEILLERTEFAGAKHLFQIIRPLRTYQRIFDSLRFAFPLGEKTTFLATVRSGRLPNLLKKQFPASVDHRVNGPMQRIFRD